MGVGDVGAELLRAGEIEGGAVDDLERAGRHFDVVDDDGARGVGHVQGGVQDGGRGWGDEGAEVPVYMVGEHDRCGEIEGDGDEAGCPLVGGEGVGCVGDLVVWSAWKAPFRNGGGEVERRTIVPGKPSNAWSRKENVMVVEL